MSIFGGKWTWTWSCVAAQIVPLGCLASRSVSPRPISAEQKLSGAELAAHGTLGIAGMLGTGLGVASWLPSPLVSSGVLAFCSLQRAEKDGQRVPMWENQRLLMETENGDRTYQHWGPGGISFCRGYPLFLVQEQLLVCTIRWQRTSLLCYR